MKNKFIIGIDVGKTKMDVSYFKRITPEDVLYFQSKDAKPTGYKTFRNSIEGCSEMLSWLKSSESDFSEQNTLFALEATGVYTHLYVKILLAQSYFVWVESPVQISKSLGIKREKNDKIDSRDIAIYASTFEGRAELFLLPDSIIFKLRRLYLIRKQLQASQIAISQLMKEHICEDKTNDGSQSTDRFIAVAKAEMAAVEKDIETLIKSDPELNEMSKILRSVPGIGQVISAFLIIRTNGFKAFDNADQFACYSGLVPFGRSSGTSLNTRKRVSFFANHESKALMYLAAKSARRSDKDLSDFYDKKIAQGKSYFSVMIAIANKLTHRIFAVIHKKRLYSKQRPEFIPNLNNVEPMSIALI